jgi:polynucleotide 5'-kinase involved in rRNA processing
MSNIGETNIDSTALNNGAARAIFLKLSEQVRKAVTYAAERRIIQELSFAEMKQRQLDIREAHYETFKWVYTPSHSRPSPTHFTEWLEHGDGTFWISGKPGSGKSTFMK